MRGNSRVRGDSRVIGAGLVGAGVCATLALCSGPGRGRHAGGQTGGGLTATASGTIPVIVFLKNQPALRQEASTRYGRRSALIQAAQTPYLDQLRQLGATDVHGYQLVNAISARVPAAALGADLRQPRGRVGDPGQPDRRGRRPRSRPGARPRRRPGRAARGAGATAASSKPTTVTAPPGTCSATTPQLSPDGLSLTGTDSAAPGRGDRALARLHRRGRQGRVPGRRYRPVQRQPAARRQAGDHRLPGLQRRRHVAPRPRAARRSSTPTRSPGRARQVYNVAGFSAQAPASPCDIRIEGTAPGASLVALKVFSNDNISTTSGFLQAIDYAVNVEHVNVLNESFGSNPFPDVTSLDAVKEFNDMATAAGVTVVVAAGDAGTSTRSARPPPTRTSSPSARRPTSASTRRPTTRARTSSRPPAGRTTTSARCPAAGTPRTGSTLDLVAPGDLSFSSCTADVAEYADCVNFLGKAVPGRGKRRDERGGARGGRGGGAGHPGVPEGARGRHPLARRRQADPAVDRDRPRRARHRAGLRAAEQPQGRRTRLVDGPLRPGRRDPASCRRTSSTTWASRGRPPRGR